MKTLNIDTCGIDQYDNRDAFLLLGKLLDIAKEANYTHVYDSLTDKTYEINEAIQTFNIWI